MCIKYLSTFSIPLLLGGIQHIPYNIYFTFIVLGKLNNWWSNTTLQRYRQKAACIIEQYGNFSIKIGDNIFKENGIVTQGENIADNGAISLAYDAYGMC